MTHLENSWEPDRRIYVQHFEVCPAVTSVILPQQISWTGQFLWFEKWKLLSIRRSLPQQIATIIENLRTSEKADFNHHWRSKSLRRSLLQHITHNLPKS